MGNLFKSAEYFINVGVPQGSILGPLLFIIFIKDIHHCNYDVNFTLFADDTSSTFSTNNTNNIDRNIDSCNISVSQWAEANGLQLNDDKTSFTVFSNSPLNTNTSLSNKIKFLGIYVDNKLAWNDHVDYICNKIRGSIAALFSVRNILNKEDLISLYYCLLQSHLDYGILTWGVCNNSYQ